MSSRLARGRLHRKARGARAPARARFAVPAVLALAAACSFPDYKYDDEAFYGSGGSAGSAGTTGGSAGSAGGGTAGSTGATGGSAGSAGSTGATGGSAGSAGASGSAGATGGSAGATGGSAGSAGSAGTGGVSGSAGTAGTAGSAGAGGGPPCNPPSGSPCDTAPQCGCAGNLKCEVTNATTGGTTCTAAGTTAPYHQCTSPGQCGAGFTCVGSTASSACKAYCEPSFGCANPAQVCGQVTGPGGVPVPGMAVCSAGCAPDLSDGVCGPTLTCVPVGSGASGSQTDCAGPVGTGVGANGCSSGDPLQCARGYVCLTDNSCRRWCRVGDTTLCGNCTSLSVTVNGQEFGFCP